MGSRGKIIQLFLNLIKNAYQAMPKGGRLELSSCEQTSGKIPMSVFEVKDTGVGIAKKNVSKIFDPFYTSKGPGEGTGLGLSICHGIVEDMKGTIEVTSKAGYGTTFRIIIPSAAQTEKKAS
jgi:two-component system NtrC family sensor kinase